MAEQLAAFGLQDTQIARALGWSPKGVGSRKRHNLKFRDAIERGRSAATAKMAAALFKRGLEGSTVDSLFWLKCVAGWNEKRGQQEVEATRTQQAPQVQIIIPKSYKDSAEWAMAVEIEREQMAQEAERNSKAIDDTVSLIRIADPSNTEVS